MHDNTLIAHIRSAILARLASQAIVTEVKQAYQPTQQGLPSGPCVFLHKILDVRHGYPQRTDVWNETTLEMEHVESEQIESTFQFNAIAPQDPADDLRLTTADLLKATARALQSDVVLDTLRAVGVGVLRVREVRNGYSVDDREQFEANPSFDAIFTHRNTTTDVVGAVTSREIVINRV